MRKDHVSMDVWSDGSGSSVEDPPYSWVPWLVVDNVGVGIGVVNQVSST